jgi:hypothetical protein
MPRGKKLMSEGMYVTAQDVRRSPFRVSVTPLPSLYRVLRSAVGGGGQRAPRAWCNAIRPHLRAADYETLAPFMKQCPMPPAPLLGLAEAPGTSFNDAIERMIATPIELLAEEIARSAALMGNRTWDVAARDPDRWLRRYVTSLLRPGKALTRSGTKHARPWTARSNESKSRRRATRSWNCSMTCCPAVSSSTTAGTSRTATTPTTARCAFQTAASS